MGNELNKSKRFAHQQSRLWKIYVKGTLADEPHEIVPDHFGCDIARFIDDFAQIKTGDGDGSPVSMQSDSPKSMDIKRPASSAPGTITLAMPRVLIHAPDGLGDRREPVLGHFVNELPEHSLCVS